MYSQLLTTGGTGNITMVEYLMAGMWILVKDPDNRKALMASAEAVPGMFGSMAKQLKDVADVADVHQEVGRGLPCGPVYLWQCLVAMQCDVCKLP